ncbi:hypothetical protein SPAN111604_03175 [Sphingomonas antarctica]|uniref:hypothetical protein n=1 Tax=Sphingomonas antarctica TaxID=2040274 RepID=UPI0039EA1CF4
MKAFLIATAMAVGIAATGPATAQMGGNMHATTTHTTTVRQTSVERHSNNGWHGPRWTKKKVCRTVWRHHKKVRSCTWQRVRVR